MSLVMEDPMLDDGAYNEDEGELHVVCGCTPGKALCGTALSGEVIPFGEGGDTTCVVCLDLEDGCCPDCWEMLG